MGLQPQNDPGVSLSISDLTKAVKGFLLVVVIFASASVDINCECAL